MQIELIPNLFIEENELSCSFIRSGGPGGQNVNKVATSVQLRFNVSRSASLSDETKERLIAANAGRINGLGQLVIEAHEYRTQEQNRADALRRLGELIREARQRPKQRIPTKAPKISGGGGPSTRREPEKRLRYYDPADWDE